MGLGARRSHCWTPRRQLPIWAWLCRGLSQHGSDTLKGPVAGKSPDGPTWLDARITCADPGRT